MKTVVILKDRQGNIEISDGVKIKMQEIVKCISLQVSDKVYNLLTDKYIKQQLNL